MIKSLLSGTTDDFASNVVHLPLHCLKASDVGKLFAKIHSYVAGPFLTSKTDQGMLSVSL